MWAMIATSIALAIWTAILTYGVWRLHKKRVINETQGQSTGLDPEKDGHHVGTKESSV